MTSRLFSFVGGAAGRWQVTRMETVIGAPLEHAAFLDILEGNLNASPEGTA